MTQRFCEKAVCVRSLLHCIVLVLAGAIGLYAHAVLVRSQPASNTKVKGPSFPIILTFNSRVDQPRSTLTLEEPGQTTLPLQIKKEPNLPEKLLSTVSNAKPGAYILRWQVLSVDGHITRGQISFEVQ